MHRTPAVLFPALSLSSRGSYFQYDSSVSFWNFLAAGNYAARFYRFAMTDVAALQMKLQEDSFAAVAAVEKVAIEVLSSASYNTAKSTVTELLTHATNEQANTIVAAWRDLLPALITK
jgi:dipeptidase